MKWLKAQVGGEAPTEKTTYQLVGQSLLTRYGLCMGRPDTGDLSGETRTPKARHRAHHQAEAENREQRTESRKQKAESRKQKAEGRRQEGKKARSKIKTNSPKVPTRLQIIQVEPRALHRQKKQERARAADHRTDNSSAMPGGTEPDLSDIMTRQHSGNGRVCTTNPAGITSRDTCHQLHGAEQSWAL